MALCEDHLKRLLAFVTIAFVGVYLAGFGLLSEDGMAGVAVFVVADGFGKALLFACVGILQHRFGWVSQRRLHGRARHLRLTGVLFGVGGVLIASLPPFGSFLGKAMLDDAAIKEGYPYLPAVLTLVSALCGAAVLRAGGRIFLGWGDSQRRVTPGHDNGGVDAGEAHERVPPAMYAAAIALLAGAVGTGVWYGFADLAQTAAHRFVDVSGYASIVYGRPAPLHAVTSSAPEWFDYLYGGGATVLALLIAGLDLWGGASGAWRAVRAASTVLVGPIRHLHTGEIGDYTAALAIGVGILAAVTAVTLT